MSFKQQQRIQQVQNIIEKDAPRYGYLTYEPFVTHLGANYQQFPNEFLAVLYEKIVEFDEYHPDVMLDDPVYGAKYREFMGVYQNCLQIYTNYMEQQRQQQLMILYQQQQQQLQQAQYQAQSQQYPNQQYPQQNNYGQNQGYQYKQNYNNQYQNNQQGQQGQQGQQNGYQGNGQQGYQKNQYRQRGYQQQNQDQTQTQGNQPQRYQHGNNQNRPHRPYNNYGNRPNYEQGQGHQQNRGQQGYGYNHKNQYNQMQQYEQAQMPEQEVEVPQVVAPPQPPPKPEPKPMKFSLDQIRNFISEWSDKDKEIVNPELIEKVNEVNCWTKGEASFDEKPQKNQDRKYDNKNNRNNRDQRDQRDQRDPREQRGDNQHNQQQQGFSTGSRFNKQSEAMPDLVKKPTGLKIEVGKNETLEARMIKKEIREKIGQDFATLMEKENETLDSTSIAKKEIIYNLNLLAPENLKDIQKDLTTYLFNEEKICHILIEQIIEKAWGQPKYASTYAKLCSDFSKIAPEKFNFQSGKDKKKENPFKLYLISMVQHSFDKKVEEIPEFENEDKKENWLKETKKKILGNVKFIAELILSKVLKKKIMKICISQLLFTFLAKYYYWRKTSKLVDSYYDYYFDALIEFIENMGDFYEKMDESGDKKDDKKDEKKEEKTGPYEPARNKIIDLIEMNEKPPEEEIEEITNLRAEDYFNLFAIIDERILKKKNSRLSALLLNLNERRSNNWQKHHTESEGPKKLKEIKQDIAKEEEEMSKVKQQKKANMEHLHDLIKAMFKDWDKGERNEKTHFKTILKEYNMVEFLTACLNQVADEKKEFLIKRLQLFDVILESYFDLSKLKTAFFECIKHMAFNSGDYPFAAATLALILKKILAKESSKLKEFYLKTEDEDEEFFLNEVYGRLYHYTNNEEIKELTKPNKKYVNMLEI